MVVCCSRNGHCNCGYVCRSIPMKILFDESGWVGKPRDVGHVKPFQHLHRLFRLSKETLSPVRQVIGQTFPLRVRMACVESQLAS